MPDDKDKNVTTEDIEPYRATVKLGIGFTINLGGYESARIDAGVEIQGKRSDMDELWVKAQTELQTQINEQVRLFKQHYNDKETLMGLPKGPSFKG